VNYIYFIFNRIITIILLLQVAFSKVLLVSVHYGSRSD
jgi:hypothetical protein